MTGKINKIYSEAIDRLKNEHIRCFKDINSPLLLVSDQYPGLWLEHVYDSVILAQLEPEYLYLAENAINLFVDKQKENGHLPFVVKDRNKKQRTTDQRTVIFSQIQECVSFFSLALDVYEMSNDTAFLSKVYDAGKKWDNWLRTYRMTTQRGLIEMFVGFDTGHDNSSRFDGISCKGNYRVDGVIQEADKIPPDDGITPILAVDMNCNFYGNEKALAKMAKILGRNDEYQYWESSAAQIKKKLFEHCYDEKDAFFYDVDRNGNKRKYKSSAIFHLFMEKVLDKEADKELISRIYKEHIKNPEEFWTPYPFPSMAMNDPSVKEHKEYNSWSYYNHSLIVLRCTRWMDYYGFGEDFDHICKKWVEACTGNYDNAKFNMEIDPVSGVPTKTSEWYSSSMIDYIYAVRRLGLLNMNENDSPNAVNSGMGGYTNFNSVNPFVRVAYEAGWTEEMPKLTHAYDCRLYYIQEGEGELLVDDVEYNAETGNLFYIPKESDYKLSLSDGACVYAIYFDLTVDSSFSKEYDFNAFFSQVICSKSKKLFENVKRCVDEFVTMTPFYREVTSGLVKQSLALLLREHLLDMGDEHNIAGKALFYCRHNITNPFLSNKDVAAYVGCHPYYVGRLVKKATGYTLRQYLQNARLERARNLLCSTKIDIATIATDCGFNSVTYFNRAFKAKIGVTPGEYRKTHMLLSRPENYDESIKSRES